MIEYALRFCLFSLLRKKRGHTKELRKKKKKKSNCHHLKFATPHGSIASLQKPNKQTKEREGLLGPNAKLQLGLSWLR